MDFQIEDEEVTPANNYREELLRLVGEGKIKHTKKYIEKASEETLEKIFKDYERKQLDEANDQLTDILIKKFSELMGSLEAVKNSDEMEKELIDNDLLRRDLKNIVSYITPYIPLIGILSGGVTVGKHVFEKKVGCVSVVESADTS